jgi:hypothetical protein
LFEKYCMKKIIVEKIYIIKKNYKPIKVSIFLSYKQNVK